MSINNKTHTTNKHHEREKSKTPQKQWETDATQEFQDAGRRTMETPWETQNVRLICVERSFIPFVE